VSDDDDNEVNDSFGSASSDGSSLSSVADDEVKRVYNLNVTDFETGI
jgi:hypothetical protein